MKLIISLIAAILVSGCAAQASSSDQQEFTFDHYHYFDFQPPQTRLARFEERRGQLAAGQCEVGYSAGRWRSWVEYIHDTDYVVFNGVVDCKAGHAHKAGRYRSRAVKVTYFDGQEAVHVLSGNIRHVLYIPLPRCRKPCGPAVWGANGVTTPAAADG